jgi:peptide/nickel transport system permease protein
VNCRRLRYCLETRGLLIFGLLLISCMALAALFAPWFAGYDLLRTDPDAVLLPPSSAHLLGTDAFGRDVFARMLYGARVSLQVGLVSVGISVSIGTSVGLAAGWFRGLVDECLMRFVDIMLCFPAFFLILAVIAFLEPSLLNIMIVIGLTSWMGTARLVRAETLSLREREFIQAARLSGAGTVRILLRHILPNAAAPVLVSATLGVGGAILTESGLSFLGIGVQYPDPSWGNILIEGKETLGVAWWLSFFPGFAILCAVLGYNLLGDGLRDMLDRRSQ